MGRKTLPQQCPYFSENYLAYAINVKCLVNEWCSINMCIMLNEAIYCLCSKESSPEEKVAHAILSTS